MVLNLGILLEADDDVEVPWDAVLKAPYAEGNVRAL